MLNISIVRPICCIIMLFLGANASGQVSWRFSSVKLNDQVFEIRLTAIVSEPWHIYSQQSPKQGPLPTAVSFNKNPLVTLDGEIKEVGDLKMNYEEVFKSQVYSYADSVSFVQLVRIKNKSTTNISGHIEYMVCTNRQCLPPQRKEFSVRVGVP